MCRIIVPTGPSTALVRIGGIQISGFLTMFGTWSIDVPIPWAIKPPTLFSLKLATANPIIWALHPTAAAPAAIPERFNITPSAAELIGRVSAIPIRTDTTIPIKNGCCSVPQLINAPSAVINSEIGGPTKRPTADPAVIVTIGVTKISTFVFPETRCPNSIPT